MLNAEVYHENIEDYHICTGTLVSTVDVLTAGHCVDSVDQSHLRIIAESVDIRNGRIFNILCIITYNQWAVINNIESSHDVNDIAIIKVKQLKIINNIYFLLVKINLFCINFLVL
jgi:V8-like Glu-specific endopeptidase